MWHTGAKKGMSQRILFQKVCAIQLAESAWGSAFEGKVIVGNSSTCQNVMLDGNFCSMFDHFHASKQFLNWKKGEKGFFYLQAANACV